MLVDCGLRTMGLYGTEKWRWKEGIAAFWDGVEAIYTSNRLWWHHRTKSNINLNPVSFTIFKVFLVQFLLLGISV